jgi:glutamine amidotransferase
MVVIIDYEVGNVGSVINMIKKVGFDCIVSNDRDIILNASKIILPGVGSFDYGMSQLEKFGLDIILKEAVGLNIPLLGICLGMQLLGNKSEEGSKKGLGFLDFDVVKFKIDSIQVPHVGWNTINVIGDKNKLFTDFDFFKFYFTHSYHAFTLDKSIIMATTNYGYEFVSAVGQSNIYGVQFHPEKSHKFGMNVINNFLNVTK